MFEIFLAVDWQQLAIGMAIAAGLAAAAWRLRMLAPSGALAAVLLGGLTFGIGGFPAAIVLVAFFVSSSVLTRLFSKRKKALAKTFSKGGQRDWAQVLANGGPALLALALGALGWLPDGIAWPAFAAALAGATADTWATELGVLSPGQPQLITTGQRVPKGTSGGVSLVGSLAAAGGALLIALVAGFVGAGFMQAGFLFSVLLAGILGSYFDSLIGATVQAIYYCPDCKKETEQHPLHSCGTATTRRRGWAWMSNDWVNFLSGLFSILALLAAATFLL
ncbi:MAG: DUF92 domain-containing protein [Anaerolineales bacterium]|nr:MAG: DUF92 domain-containing protein [Anaerolineales bacterium]